MTPASHYQADSFYVYSRIYPNRFNPILWSLVGGSGLVLALMSMREKNGKWEFYAGLLLIGIFLLKYISVQVMKLLTYKTYKTFREHIGFSVDGWDSLVKNPELMKAQFWALNSSVEVEMKSTASENDRTFVQDALFLFTTESNMRFYKGSNDGRIKWKIEKPLRAVGSADVAVSGDIYNLLQKYLRSIHQKTGCIQSVNVVWDENVQYVKFSKGAY
jgi:hypothetical protein